MELLTDRKKHPIFLSSRNLQHTQLILQKDTKREVSRDLSVNITGMYTQVIMLQTMPGASRNNQRTLHAIMFT